MTLPLGIMIWQFKMSVEDEHRFGYLVDAGFGQMDIGTLFGERDEWCEAESSVTTRFIRMECSCGSENRGPDAYQKQESGIKRIKQTKIKVYLCSFLSPCMQDAGQSPEVCSSTCLLSKFHDSFLIWLYTALHPLS